jgi:HEAT repeat protein
LVRLGSVDERQRAAIDLRVVSARADIDAVIAALASALEDRDAGVRATAAESMGAVICALALRTSHTTEEQQLATRRIDSANRILLKRLSDADPMVRAAILRGLEAAGKNVNGNLPPELFAGLRDASPSVRQATLKLLQTLELTPAAVPSLIEALQSPDVETRFRAAEILGRLGPDASSAVPALLATLREPWNPDVRKKNPGVAWYWDPACSAAKALGQIAANEEIVSHLAEMLSSDVAERASSAAAGLGEIGPRALAAVPKLIIAYERAQKPGQHMIGQSAISQALGQIAPKTASAPAAIAILTKGLDSDDVWVRVGSASALGRFGGDAAGAIPKLRALSQDAPRELRDAVRASLAAIETRSGESATFGPPAT